jgi:hypothetical protein
MEGVYEMLGILTSHIPDTEIIHNKRECDGACDVFPKAWSEGYMMGPLEIQTARKEVVWKDTILMEAVYSFLDLHLDVSIKDKYQEVVLFNDFHRE